MRKKDQWIIHNIHTGKSRSFDIRTKRSFRHTKFPFGGLAKGGLTVLISVLIIYGIVQAGTITPPSGTPVATFYSLSEIYNFIATNATSTEGSPALDWSSTVTSTPYTLTEIYNALAGLISADKVKLGTTYLNVAGTLVPSGGTATTSDVLSGKTFFGDSQTNWTLQTGTFDPWTPQWLQTKDDWWSSAGTSTEYIAEEATWAEVSGSPFSGYNLIDYTTTTSTIKTLDLYSGTVKQDTRTGLWWSDVTASGTTIDTATNIFTLTADGSRPTGGDAIGFCNALNSANFGGYNNWYLPTQKQLQQAYIDGSANNLSNPDYYFWSSSEKSWDSTNAWSVYLGSGPTTYLTKVNSTYVRCVRP